jgi:diguanylate cyclase (GGDEF)-like protein
MFSNLVLLASADSRLLEDLRQTLCVLGMQVESALNAKTALAAMRTMQGQAQGLILLDTCLPGVANGHLLAAMLECEERKQHAIVLLADQVSDEWIARLREGVIDDIVPPNADAEVWKAHMSTMQRSQALARELEQMRETTVLEVQHDPLTGTFTRDTMLTILFRETDRVQRLQGSLSVVACDLDDFGHWNNELGQDAGDQLLREAARRIGRTLRSYDVLGRLGGDDFLIALPGCSIISAVELTERLRIEAFGESFWVKDKHKETVEVRLSACFGITTSRSRSPVVVVREAQRTLECAKLAGPDSTQCASEACPLAEPDTARLFTDAEASETLVR